MTGLNEGSAYTHVHLVICKQPCLMVSTNGLPNSQPGTEMHYSATDWLQKGDRRAAGGSERTECLPITDMSALA